MSRFLVRRLPLMPLLLLMLPWQTRAEPYPVIDTAARVKQYRSREGALLPEQDEMRKLIVSWSKFPDATAYQVCMDCSSINDAGVRVNSLGTVRTAEMEDTCAGEPCLVYHAIPRGSHSFHVRAVLGLDEYTRWSPPRTYDVQEPGRVHDEL